MNESNVILTGLPRGGTTLVCYLLNQLPDIVALHEPMDIKAMTRLKKPPLMMDYIERFFAETRRSLLERHVAPSKNSNGRIVPNPYSDAYSENGVRKGRSPLGEVYFDKPLSDDFMLCVKHPAAFTALLPVLVKRFPCYAIVRNPLSVLASWNSVAMPPREGRSPTIERIDKHFRYELKHFEDRFDRQIYLITWYFKQYKLYLPESAIFRYEDVIASGGRALQTITPEALTLNETFTNKNKNPLYDSDLMALLARKLLAVDGAAVWDFYTREQIMELV